MATWRNGPEKRAKQYAQRYDRVIQKELGFGYDGIVFSTNCQKKRQESDRVLSHG